MRALLAVTVVALVAATPAAGHHAASAARVEAHHTASGSAVQAHHAASGSGVQAHHAASGSGVQAHHAAEGARVQAHHTASGAALAAGAAEAEAAGEEIARGPNDGALVPLGDGVAALEFTFDPKTGMFEMYVWDGALEKPIQLSQDMVFLKIPVEDSAEHDRGVMLVPVENEATGERKGHASKFHGGLKWLIGRERFEVVLEGVEIDDRYYRLAHFPIPEGLGNAEGHPAGGVPQAVPGP